MLGTKTVKQMVIYNHTAGKVMRRKRPLYSSGKLIGFHVRGVRRRASAVYTLGVICDLLDYGFVTRSNGLALELIN